MDCVLNRPTCKRTIMERKGPFIKEVCPLSEKPKCMFQTEQCPLLPEEKGCTLTKVAEIIKAGGCFANQPPPPRNCCCCCVQETEFTPDPIAECRINKVIQMPPCTRCKQGFGSPVKPVAKDKIQKTAQSQHKKRKTTSNKKSKGKPEIQMRNLTVPDCTLSSRRPFPCSECLMDILNCPLSSVDYDSSKVYCKARARPCPFTQIIDVCDVDCLCVNVPSINTGPRCPFLPKPVKCRCAPCCPLSKIPPNPLVERVLPPACKKQRCRCFCPIIPGPCSITLPECPVHCGKIKCPLLEGCGSICPAMMPKICVCPPPRKIKSSPKAPEVQVTQKINYESKQSKQSKQETQDKKSPSITKENVETADPNSDLVTNFETSANVNRVASTSRISGQNLKLFNEVQIEKQISLPPPNQEQYQKSSRSRRTEPWREQIISKSDEFPFFVDMKQNKGLSIIDIAYTQSNYSRSLACANAGATEAIYESLSVNQSQNEPRLTTSALYSEKTDSNDKIPRSNCGCLSQISGKKNKKMTNYPSIVTESLYKSRKNDSPKKKSEGRKKQKLRLTIKKSELAKLLPPATTLPTDLEATKKTETLKLCKSPAPNIYAHPCECKSQVKYFDNPIPKNDNISGMEQKAALDYAEKMRMKLETPEFKFLEEFNICECNANQVIPVRAAECPCEQKIMTHSRFMGSRICPCGKSCPSKLQFATAERTFHVPTCPLAVPLPQPKSPSKNEMVCPFAPNQCPLGPYCIFPVHPKYDPSAPPIPKPEGVCFCKRQSCLKTGPTNSTQCPLESLLHKKSPCPPCCPMGSSACSKPCSPCMPCSPCSGPCSRPPCGPCSPPICPLAPPPTQAPVFRECPFNTCQCTPKKKRKPKSIKRLCKCCAEKEAFEESNRCRCQSSILGGRYGNITKCNCNTKKNKNVKPDICRCDNSPNAKVYVPQLPSSKNYNIPEVASLPKSLQKLLNKKISKPPIRQLECLSSLCLCEGNEMYPKANYDIYLPDPCQCCPCKKPKMKCPLGITDCPCLNLTITSVCPLNATQCSMERPICPMPPKIKPVKMEPIQTLKKDSSMDRLESQSNLNKLEPKIQTLKKDSSMDRLESQSNLNKLEPQIQTLKKDSSMDRLESQSNLNKLESQIHTLKKDSSMDRLESQFNLNKFEPQIQSLKKDTSMDRLGSPSNLKKPDQIKESSIDPVTGQPLTRAVSIVLPKIRDSRISFSNSPAKSVSYYIMKPDQAKYRPQKEIPSKDRGFLKLPPEQTIPKQPKATNNKLVTQSPKCALEKPDCVMRGAKPAMFATLFGNEPDSKPHPVPGPKECAIMQPPCDLFPQGRCPMREIGACNCNYPVAPCMAPAQCGYVLAAPQYCYKEDCCMGLPLPPTYPAQHGKYDTGTYYKFMDWKPGEKATKHYIDISEEPIEMNFFKGHEQRLHDNWWIIRAGKGYEECEKVKEIIRKRGPVGHRASQFDSKDNPMDIETQTIYENRKHREEEKRRLENTRADWS